jgi:hypothetical protein
LQRKNEKCASQRNKNDIKKARGKNKMGAIFIRASKASKNQYASKHTVKLAWCIWCIKNKGSALLKKEK